MRRFFFLLAITAAAQDNPEPTFHAGTELVQVSVVAQDKNGKPVSDLRREDFHVFDNGVEQKIALFLEERPAPAPEIALPPGVFTNQIVTDAHGRNSVLLFDKVNIDSGGATEHLAGIPRRKNLAWLTTTFRLKPIILQKLLNANVAIYPVDTLGSTIALCRDKEMHAMPMRALAAMTGGKAYID